MNVGTASRLISLTKGIYPSSKADEKDTLDIWMGLFGNKDDGLMETALHLCWTSYKFFPSPAEIKEAIKELLHEEQTQPKQLAWEVKRNNSLHQKIMEMAIGKTDTKSFISKLDVTKLMQYAKVFFPDISEETVKRNYPEFAQGRESQDMCFSCRYDQSACLTKGYQIRHALDHNGYVKNEMLKCQKNM
jgi:hypothetical protein